MKFLVLALVVLSSCGRTAQPVKWERGWKTPHVIAARHPSAAIGYTIAFDFPLNASNCDRVEVGEFVEDHGGSIYQGGGHPGATAYAIFVTVKDDRTADIKMLEILPAFDRLMADMSDGKKIVKTAAQIERDKKRKEDEGKCNSGGGWLNVNNNIYKCDPTAKRWVIDKEATERSAQDERNSTAHMESLAFALVSRVITDEEMREVESLGIDLYTRTGQAYYEKDLRERLNGALLQQFRLRAARDAGEAHAR